MSSNSRKREEMYKRQKGRCPLCQLPFPLKDATIDHIIPKSRGGTNIRENLHVTCKQCNFNKNNLTTNEYLERYTID